MAVYDRARGHSRRNSACVDAVVRQSVRPVLIFTVNVNRESDYIAVVVVVDISAMSE